jgi:hypothetical protein
MARPPKKPETRMDKDLRIPVTAEQRATVNQAAGLAGSDMAAWARPILLDAAKREMAKHRGGKTDT